MPWPEMSPVEQRERFIDDHRLGLYDMTELCARYVISRKTGYKWLARYDAGGRPALQDRSRAPHACPHQIPAAVAQRLVTSRLRAVRRRDESRQGMRPHVIVTARNVHEKERAEDRETGEEHSPAG